LKRVLVLVVLLLFAGSSAFSDSTLVESFGEWKCFETGSMLDSTRWVIQISDGAYVLPEVVYLLISSEGYINFGVDFGTALYGQVRYSYVKGLTYITDKMDEPITFTSGLFKLTNTAAGFISNENQNQWDRIQSILADLMTAEEVQFRTGGIMGGNEDVYFELNPEDTQAAVNWITEQVDAHAKQAE